MAKNEFPRRTRASLIIQYFRVSKWNLDDLDYFLARFPNSIPFHNFVYVETFCEYFWRFFFHKFFMEFGITVYLRVQSGEKIHFALNIIVQSLYLRYTRSHRYWRI